MTFANEYLSYSRIKRYEKCPRSFELHYVRRAPAHANPATQFGSVLHRSLEATYRAIVAEGLVGPFPETRLLADFEAAWTEAGLTDFPLFGEGRAILHRYAREHADVDAGAVLAVEQEFRLPVGRFEVLGYIDRVDRLDTETVRVVDYKSNRAIFTRDEVDHDLQLSLYAMAARQLWPWARRVRLGFYLLRHGFLIETARSDADLATARAYVATLGEQIETATEFPPRLNEHCAYCDHAAQCPAYQRALLGQVDASTADAGDLEAVAREREDVARVAKVLHARKDALDRVLRAHLGHAERLELGDVVYSLGTVAHTTYRASPTLALLRGATGRDETELAALLLTVDKPRLEALLRDLGASMPAAQLRMLRAQLEAAGETSYSPRLQAQPARRAGGAQ
jgi:RecB family exonuclease